MGFSLENSAEIDLRGAPLICRHYDEVIKELRGEIETIVPDYGVHLNAKSAEDVFLSQDGKDWPGVVENRLLKVHDSFCTVIEFDRDPIITIVTCIDDPNHLAVLLTVKARWAQTCPYF
ncbi:MAG TPA: hypothetical protein VIC28_15650 [Thermoanaerobaculia bacterium]